MTNEEYHEAIEYNKELQMIDYIHDQQLRHFMVDCRFPGWCARVTLENKIDEEFDRLRMYAYDWIRPFLKGKANYFSWQVKYLVVFSLNIIQATIHNVETKQTIQMPTIYGTGDLTIAKIIIDYINNVEREAL